MAQRMLMFKSGHVGLVCACYMVEIQEGGQDRKGTMRTVGDCTNLATELLEGTDGTTTCVCLPCHDLIAASLSIGKVLVQRPKNN
jgi:hypothetical protein